MTFAVNILKVDEALVARYSGMTIGGTAVEVFIEDPDPEEYPERVFPSISIQLIGMPAAPEQLDTDDDVPEEVAWHPSPTTPIRDMKDPPRPYRLLYSIDTWNRQLVSRSRDFLMEAMVARTPINGYLTVENVDGENVDLWCFARGDVLPVKEKSADDIVYHGSRTIEVWAYLDSGQSIVEEKATVEMEWGSYVHTMIPDPDNPGQVIPEVGGDKLDIRFVITEDGVVVV